VQNSEWEELHQRNLETIFKHKNKKYGVYQLSKSQPNVLMYISFGVIAAGIISIYAKVIVNNYEGVNTMLFSEVSDTTQFSLSNQNIQETPPSHFNFEGDNGDGQATKQDGGERAEKNPETTESSEPIKQEKKSAEQSIYDFEKELYAKEGGAAEREKITEDMARRKKEREEKKRQQQKVDGGIGGNVGTNSGTQGKTLAEWNMNGRSPYQKNPDYIKIPGYMCGKGVNEKIVVKIKVNSNGDVYYAQSMAPSSANPCCVEQALIYAKKSRFDYSEKPIEEGTITYYFKSQ
jgi:hypothetical protein